MLVECGYKLLFSRIKLKGIDGILNLRRRDGLRRLINLIINIENVVNILKVKEYKRRLSLISFLNFIAHRLFNNYIWNEII